MLQDFDVGANFPPAPPLLEDRICLSTTPLMQSCPETDDQNLETKRLVRENLYRLKKHNADIQNFDDLDCLQKFITQTISRGGLGYEDWDQLAVSGKLYYIVQHFNTEPILQNGPSCGFAALSMALRILVGSECSLPPIEEMVEKARSCGLTNCGEMFSAEALLRCGCDVSKEVEGRVSSKDLTLLHKKKLVLKSLMQKHLVLIPYDKGPNNDPCFKNGLKAHWAVLTGLLVVLTNKPHDLQRNLLDYDDDKAIFSLRQFPNQMECAEEVLDILERDEERRFKLHVFARQGKSLRLHLWNLDELVESNGQLRQTPESHSYALPAGGIEAGLCGKFVILKNT